MMMEQFFNPWPGTATYQDPQNDKGGFMFCGRVNETIDMVRLIDNKLFVTLYGPTGVGKSSLLNAGVFPRLRKLGYFPISIRFSEEDSTIPYAKIIVNKIQSSGLVTSVNVEIDNNDPESIVYLWRYFTTTSFKDKDGEDGKEIYPVFVFDQFEEIFFDKNNKENTEKAKLFLQQIYALLDDYLIVPQEPGYSNSTNYRFVASIREDDLCVLEDVIDDSQLQSMKNNRYRLKELSPEKATDIIRIPGKEYKCIDDVEIDEVADQIVDIARNDDGTISSLMISLLCNSLYSKGNGKITSKLVEEEGQTTLKDYCKKFLKDWTSDELDVFLEELISKDRRRKRCFKDDLENKIPKVKNLYSKDSRLLKDVQVPNCEPVIEIIHDKFASILPTAISEIKAEEAKKHAKHRKIALWIIVPILILSLLTALWYRHQYRVKPFATTDDVLVQIILMPDESLEGYDWEAGVQFDIDSTWQARMAINDSVIKVTKADTISVGPRLESGYFSDTIVVSISPEKITLSSFYINVIPRNLCKGMSFRVNVEESDYRDSTLTMIKRTITLSRSKDAVFKFKGVAITNDDIPIRDAIVVLDDHVARTDESGEFKFYLNDSTELRGQTLYVLKNEFKPFEIQGDSILKNISRDRDFFTMGRIKLALRDEFIGYDGLLKTQSTIYNYYGKYGSTDGIDTILIKADSIRLNRYKLLGSSLSVGSFKSLSGDTVFYFVRKSERAADHVLGYYLVNKKIAKQFSGTLKSMAASDNNSRKGEWNVDLSAFDKAYNREHITGILRKDDKFQITKMY